MNKRKVSRVAGFMGAAGMTAALVTGGVNMTGAFFQDTESGSLQATTGEVDAVVNANTPLTQSFQNLMPGEPGDMNTYRVHNVGTGDVDYYLGSANWNAIGLATGAGNPGSSISNGVVTLTNPGGGAGTSFEWTDLDVPVANGDTISFEWKSADVNCGGGVPRVFIQGGAYNTHNGNLDQCSNPADSAGWRQWTATVSGITDGSAGHTGIVNDNPSDPGTIQVRNVEIDGASITAPPFNLCDPAHDELEVRVHSSTHDTGFQNLCNLPTGNSPILIAQNVATGTARDVNVTLRLNGAATNVWANKIGTADLMVIATQAGQTPTAQGDQSGPDA